MKVYCVRHLSTKFNKSGLLQGSQDISILTPSKNDLLDIEKNRIKISSFNYDTVLVSELIRTQETAQLYGFDKFKTEPLINELNFGKYEGKPKEKFLKDVGDQWYSDVSKICLGESLVDFEKRIRKFTNAYQGKNVLMFCHGAYIRGLIAICELGCIDLMNTYHVENNSLTILDFNK